MSRIYKIGICGASGYIGHALYRYLKNKKLKVMGTYCNTLKKELIKFDLREDSFEVFDKCDFVVILSAYAKIKFCEDNKIEAYWLNVYRTKQLLEYLDEKKIPALFISSDAAITKDTTYGIYKRRVERFISDNFLLAGYIRPGKITDDNIQDLCKEIHDKIKHLGRQENMKTSNTWGAYPIKFNTDKKVCKVCGKKFTPRSPMQKYCTKECRNEAIISSASV